jgi:hypothetical protein
LVGEIVRKVFDVNVHGLSLLENSGGSDCRCHLSIGGGFEDLVGLRVRFHGSTVAATDSLIQSTWTNSVFCFMPRGRPRNPAWNGADLKSLFEVHGSVAAVAVATGLSEESIRKTAQRQRIRLPGKTGHRILPEETIVAMARYTDRAWYLEPEGLVTLEEWWVQEIAKQNAVLLGMGEQAIVKRLVNLSKSGVINIVKDHPVNSLDDSVVLSEILRHFGVRAFISGKNIVDVIPDPVGTLDQWKDAGPQFANPEILENFRKLRGQLIDEAGQIYLKALIAVNDFLESEEALGHWRKRQKQIIFDKALTLFGATAQNGLKGWEHRQVALMQLTPFFDTDISGEVVPSDDFAKMFSDATGHVVEADALQDFWEWLEKVRQETGVFVPRK